MRAFFLAFALLLPSALHGQSNDTSNPIIARIDALVAAYNAQDVAAIGAVYAPDAALLAPGEPMIIGRDSIMQHYADAIAGGARDVQFTTFDIQATETSAVAIGEVVLEVGENRIVTRYMHLWQVIDGQILLARDMYHVLAVQ